MVVPPVFFLFRGIAVDALDKSGIAHITDFLHFHLDSDEILFQISIEAMRHKSHGVRQ